MCLPFCYHCLFLMHVILLLLLLLPLNLLSSANKERLLCIVNCQLFMWKSSQFFAEFTSNIQNSSIEFQNGKEFTSENCNYQQLFTMWTSHHQIHISKQLFLRWDKKEFAIEKFALSQLLMNAHAHQISISAMRSIAKHTELTQSSKEAILCTAQDQACSCCWWCCCNMPMCFTFSWFNLFFCCVVRQQIHQKPQSETVSVQYARIYNNNTHICCIAGTNRMMH